MSERAWVKAPLTPSLTVGLLLFCSSTCIFARKTFLNKIPLTVKVLLVTVQVLIRSTARKLRGKVVP